MSHVINAKNKDADQLCMCSNCTADQHLCFHYIQSFKLLAFFCDCIGQFVSDLSETQKTVSLMSQPILFL